MCFTITDKFQNSITGATRMMPWSQYTKIIDDAKDSGVYSINISWRGESTLYRVKDENGNVKTFGDAIKYACSKNFLEVTSLTHGQNLTDQLIDDIVEAQPNWISFSVDGLEEEYNKIRTPRNKRNDKTYNPFDVVTNNIQKLANKRDQKNAKLPRIRTNSVFPAISKYPKKYKSFMKSIGVDLVTTSEVSDYREHRLKDEEIDKDWSCAYPFQRMTVSANSIILPCPAADQEEEALVFGRYKGSPPKITKNYDGSVNMTSIPENTILSAWHSKKWNGLRNDNVRVGQRLKVFPRRAPKQTVNKKYTGKPKVTYKVAEGDTLWDISKKFPGVSISDIKYRNNLSSSSLNIGTVLVIE